MSSYHRKNRVLKITIKNYPDLFAAIIISLNNTHDDGFLSDIEIYFNYTIITFDKKLKIKFYDCGGSWFYIMIITDTLKCFYDCYKFDTTKIIMRNDIRDGLNKKLNINQGKYIKAAIH